MALVDGHCSDRFESVRDAFTKNITDDVDCGASLAVILDGETVIDLWGGHADEARTIPWEQDTITNVWSTTKTMVFLSALMLADRGLLDLDAPVAEYWPEFAANGKADIRVRHLMSHTSGVSGWAEPIPIDALYDWERSTSILAAQAPWWEPGTASGYHALNQGHLIGEVIRRITGMTFKDFFAAEVAGPLSADFTIGSPEANHHRIADVTPPAPLPIDLASLDMNSPMVKTFANPAVDASWANSAEWRTADIGAANGHGNARSVATIQSAISHGGKVGDTTLLSPATIARIFEQQSEGPDLVLGFFTRFGMGYCLPVPETVDYLPTGRACFWGGWGGSLVVNDLDRTMTVAFMMNRMADGVIGGVAVANILRALIPLV
jgi:CubicO group peptidase (beta-lactamase class C family)